MSDRELEERFFEINIDLLCQLDFNGFFKRLNPAWERTLGWSRAELMSRPFIEFVHPDDRARTLGQNARVRSGGQALEFENRYLCKDGSFRWLLWNAAPDANGGVIYSVARDVTERKRAEEEREQLVRWLTPSRTCASRIPHPASRIPHPASPHHRITALRTPQSALRTHSGRA